MSYQEKRTWILLVTQAVAYGAYYWTSLHRGHFQAADMLRFVIALIVSQIVLQSLLAATSRPDRSDERDMAIASKAFHVGYVVLTVALVVFIGVLACHWVKDYGAMFVINALLFALFFAEISKLGTQVAMYRRLA